METQKASKSKTAWGAYLTAASGVIAAAGPNVLQAAGFDPEMAVQCAQAIVVLLNAVAAQLVITGRANANIKPLG